MKGLWIGRTQRTASLSGRKGTKGRKKEQGRDQISHPGFKSELCLPGFEMTVFKYGFVIANCCIEAGA